MKFSKKFPRTVPGSNFPVWEEISLTEEQEKEIESHSKKINFQLMDECLTEAKQLSIKHQLNTEENVTRIATSLFEKRASHQVFWKERKAKELFDSL